jgi:hypothetical protein
MMAHPSIKRVEELRAKRFGIQNMGSSTWMHTMLALEYVGLEPKRDNINILSIGDSVLIGQALEATSRRSRPRRRTRSQAPQQRVLNNRRVTAGKNSDAQSSGGRTSGLFAKTFRDGGEKY